MLFSLLSLCLLLSWSLFSSNKICGSTKNKFGRILNLKMLIHINLLVTTAHKTTYTHALSKPRLATIALPRQVAENRPLMPHQEIRPHEGGELGWWNANYKQFYLISNHSILQYFSIASSSLSKKFYFQTRKRSRRGEGGRHI